MYRKAHPLFLICNTPTHVGSGSELGVVDLPIQRERHTGFPKFEASSLKGSIREAFEKHKKAEELKIHRLFGYDSDAASDATKKYFERREDQQFSGAIGFTDARLLLFPVKSMKGVFAWITCFKALKQFQSDMQLVNPNFKIKNLDEKAITQNYTYAFNPESNNIINSDKVILEEYTFNIENELNEFIQIQQDEHPMNLPEWLAKNLFEDNGSYWSEKIKKDIIVLPDDDFKDFVNLSTEVITRIKINNTTGTVAQTALFNEEYLPAESILYSLTLTTAEFKEHEGLNQEDVFDFFSSNLNEIKTIQIGGNATLGKGILTSKLLQTI